ncbi:CoA transferase [Salipiger sp.]|uniref:CoA transferase n=1 Tax=Salipiger sp. TaxID=2078585 RepID=UPI003A97B8FB
MNVASRGGIGTAAALTRPLEGLRVIEVSSFVAAPLGGMTLAQLGAEVIRVDPVGGAADRDRWPLAPDGTSLFWEGLNRGKKSVALDLTRPEGKAILADLVCAEGDGGGGGILLTNAPQRPWNSHETLSARRGDVIRIALSGNFDGSQAVDYTINCAGGFALATGPDETPVNHVLPAWDMAAGLYLSTAILAADRHRMRTGRGQSVELALSDVMISMLGSLGYLADIQVNGSTRSALGNDLYGAFGRDFRTRDGRDVMIVALTARQWHALCGATGLDPALPGPEPTGGDLYRARREIARALDGWCAERTHDEIAAIFDAHRVLWGPYNDFATFFRSDRRCSTENPLMRRVDHPGAGPILMPGCPLHFSESGPDTAADAPVFGGDGVEVLGSVLGLGRARIDALIERGLLG